MWERREFWVEGRSGLGGDDEVSVEAEAVEESGGGDGDGGG